jgi:hypothetical protein
MNRILLGISEQETLVAKYIDKCHSAFQKEVDLLKKNLAKTEAEFATYA